MARLNRRQFVSRSAQLGTLAGAGSFAFLQNLPTVSASDAAVERRRVQLNADIEPLVRFIEETPREKLLEETASRIGKGTSYQELLAALFLAGVRGIEPRPVGFKFHAVMVINSAHLASLAASDRDRWLPLFWSLDNFKSSQVRNRREGDWAMGPAAPLPPDASKARKLFVEAMDRWDVEAADRAVVPLVRQTSSTDVIELLWRYGMRDYRNIGHKAIYVANACRTLQTIGWRHAEPVARSLAYAMLAHEGDNPAKRDDFRDQPWRDNQRRMTKIRKDWQSGKVSRKATIDLLAALRTGTAAECSEKVVALLNQKYDPRSIWDGLFLMAGEHLMRQPGIIGLHCVTTMNALHYGYQTSGNDETRRLFMLQGAAFLPLFRQSMKDRGKIRDDVQVDNLHYD